MIDASINLTEHFENPETANVGVLALEKYIEIEAEEDVLNNLDWILIKMYYTDEEVTSAGIDESTLRMYYYNESTSTWEVMSDSGVNTTGNYVWGNTTHLSFFGLFGNPPPTTITTTTAPPSSGGGPSGRRETTTTTIPTTTIAEVTTTTLLTTTTILEETTIPMGEVTKPTVSPITGLITFVTSSIGIGLVFITIIWIMFSISYKKGWIFKNR